jgi:SAM-dependent methyltransferase
MLTSSLQKLIKTLSCTPLHPQWLANKWHLQKFKSLTSLTGKRVLDVGSGNSAIAKFIHASNYLVRSDYPVVSIRYKNSPEVYLDARELPFKSGSFDCVFLFEVLEHIDEFELVIKEAERVLAVDGEIYLSMPFLYPEHDAPYDFQRLSRYGLKSYLDKYSFDIIDDVKMGSATETIFMLANLYLLLLLVELEKRIGFFSVLFIPLVATLCFTSNIMAFLLNIILPDFSQIYIGCFIKARKC